MIPFDVGSVAGAGACPQRRFFADRVHLSIGNRVLPTSRPGRPTGSTTSSLLRVSRSLWSSAPDEDLIQLCGQGRLHDSKVIEQQVARMIATRAPMRSSRTSRAMAQRSRHAASEAGRNLFPDFDSTLREAFRREIELFFGSIIHEDAASRLLTAATRSSRTAAKHLRDPERLRIAVPPRELTPELDMRRGPLGKGALLTITPTRPAARP